MLSGLDSWKKSVQDMNIMQNGWIMLKEIPSEDNNDYSWIDLSCDVKVNKCLHFMKICVRLYFKMQVVCELSHLPHKEYCRIGLLFFLFGFFFRNDTSCMQSITTLPFTASQLRQLVMENLQEYFIASPDEEGTVLCLTMSLFIWYELSSVILIFWKRISSKNIKK